MRRLLLLRHAKATQDRNFAEDENRPLVERGVLDAWAMGGYLAETGLKPDHVLVSAALRTRQTRDLVLPRMGYKGSVEERADLYLASRQELLRAILALPEAVETLLLIGHNEGLQEVAVQLAFDTGGFDMLSLRSKLPTCGFVALELPVEPWRAVRSGEGKLTHYMTPRRLRGEPE